MRIGLGFFTATTIVLLTSFGSVSAADVVVFHGTEVETVSTTTGERVTVLRGKPPKAKAPATRSRTAAVRQQGSFVAGESFWYVDSRGRLVGCKLRGTGRIDGLKVICSRHR